MKAKKCELWIGTSCAFFKFGTFESITACRKYIQDCITCYHEIRVINPQSTQ